MSDKPTVLVVDDEVAQRGAVRMALRGKYNLLETENYEDAKDLLRDHASSISLVITDFNYPGVGYNNMVGGADLVQLIEQSYPHIPVIVMSGYYDDFNAEIKKRGAVYPHRSIAKPVQTTTPVPALNKPFSEAVALLTGNPEAASRFAPAAKLTAPTAS